MMMKRVVRLTAGYYAVAGATGFVASKLVGGPLPFWITVFLLSVPPVAGIVEGALEYFGKNSATT